MRIHNAEIAAIFNKLADLLEIQGENPFRIRAYRNATRILVDMPEDVANLLEKGADLTKITGIGADLANKIKTIVTTGELPLLNETAAHVPPLLSQLMQIEGLGPKRVQRLYKELYIHNMIDLKRAIKQGTIQKLPGFGVKIAQRIQEGVKYLSERPRRFKLADTIPVADYLLSYLKKHKDIKIAECAGSFRRRKETVGDLDILVISNENVSVVDYFVKFEEVVAVISKGMTRSTVRLRSGLQVDLRVVAPASYGAALLYFTGSKAHNLRLRKIAIGKKLKINEYGIFKGKKYIAGKTEKDVYKQIGLSYIEPELREERGEIEAAQRGKLPELISLNDIRGDLHCHTHATDGKDSLEAMAKAAAELGYDYIAITDHSHSLTVAHGLDSQGLQQQINKIDQLNQKLKNIVILKSCEVDILEDGSLDLPNSILHQLDMTICSIHSRFNLSQKKQTERIIRAMDNPYFNILAHPTGRLLDRREPYAVDIAKIMQAAKERGCILEINAQLARMDLDDVHCKMAKELRLPLVISTDAHSTSQLRYMCFGVYQARRGWLEKKDVINTHSVSKLKKLLQRNR